MEFPNRSGSQSVLVVGATGRTGLALIKALARHNYSAAAIHAFCRDPSKLPQESRSLCTSVQRGNARQAEDILNALECTKPDWVIISAGNGDNIAKDNIRERSAEATVRVLQMPNFQHIRVVIVSSIGAGGSKMKIGMGLGRLVSYQLRRVLADHTKQEDTFLKSSVSSRTTVVRATSLVDNSTTTGLVEFGDREKCPTDKTDRYYLAARIAFEINRGQTSTAARVYNLTNQKQ